MEGNKRIIVAARGQVWTRKRYRRHVCRLRYIADSILIYIVFD